MKSIRVHEFGGPEVMKLEEVPDLIAGQGQVVVRIHAIGVNPVDTYIRSGMYGAKPSLPYTTGMDAAGVVEWIGHGGGKIVIGTGGTEKGRASVAHQGAHHVLDHHAHDYLDQVQSLTGGSGVNVILEMLANVNLGKDLGVLAKFGRVVVIGSRGPVEINPRDAMGRDASIHAMTLMNVNDHDRMSIHAALVAGLENGTLKPVVGKEMPLAEAARAHQTVLEAGSFGKIVLIP